MIFFLKIFTMLVLYVLLGKTFAKENKSLKIILAQNINNKQ